MLDDPHPTAATLTDILVYARSRPSLDELLAFFTSGAPALVDCDEVEVRPGPPGDWAPDTHDGGAHVSCHPVSCGPTLWGELRLTYLDGSPSLSEIHRGRLLAEVLGAALVSAGVEAGAPSVAARDPDAPGADVGHPDPEDLVDLVLHCAEALDVMADASTRARLAVVVSRLAEAVGATTWSVGLRHEGLLHDVASTGVAGSDDEGSGGAVAAAGSVVLADFPARLRASEGGGFYADRSTGDAAERRALAEGDETAVFGAGGYDLDGRSWVVTVVAGSGAHLQHVTPVLFALVLAALSFPREAVVPRPQDPWIREILSGSGRGRPGTDVRGFGEAG